MLHKGRQLAATYWILPVMCCIVLIDWIGLSVLRPRQHSIGQIDRHSDDKCFVSVQTTKVSHLDEMMWRFMSEFLWMTLYRLAR